MAVSDYKNKIGEIFDNRTVDVLKSDTNTYRIIGTTTYLVVLEDVNYGYKRCISMYDLSVHA